MTDAHQLVGEFAVNATGVAGMSKRGLLIVMPWEVAEHGGVDAVVRQLLVQFRRGDEYDPLLMQNSWHDRRPRWGVLHGTPVVSVRLRGPFARSGMAFGRHFLFFCAGLPLAFGRIRRLLAQRDVAVVNIHFPGLFACVFALLRSLRLLRAKLVLSVHGSDLRNAFALHGVRAAVLRWMYGRADAIVTVSHALRSQLVQAMPELASKLTVIPNGVDPALFEAAAARHLHPRPDEHAQPTILAIASLDRYKGLDVLLRAFHSVRQSVPSAVLVVAGHTGSEAESLRRLAAHLGLDGCVDWRINVPHAEIPGILERADLLVLPSRSEGFPLVLLEAGASAIPVVATRVGGIPELIDDGLDGLLVPPDDADSMAAAIQQLVSNPARASEFARRLHGKVCGRFTWSSTHDAYVNLLRTLGV